MKTCISPCRFKYNNRVSGFSISLCNLITGSKSNYIILCNLKVCNNYPTVVYGNGQIFLQIFKDQFASVDPFGRIILLRMENKMSQKVVIASIPGSFLLKQEPYFGNWGLISDGFASHCFLLTSVNMSSCRLHMHPICSCPILGRTENGYPRGARCGVPRRSE